MAVLPIKQSGESVSAVNFAARSVIYVILTVVCVITLVPIVWLIAATTKRPDEVLSVSYPFFSPHPTLQNFADLFAKVPFVRYFMNSAFITCATVMTQLFFSSLGGFALAKYEFKGKGFIVGLMIATMMIPGTITLAPSYELMFRLGLIDTYQGLIIPGAVSVFGMFLFRQAIQAVPDELIHAARIDGCTEFGIYWNVVMPVVRPMIGAFCLMTFMGTWNGFLWPQILLHSQERFTLPIALNQMIGLYNNEYGMLMAGTLLSVLPVVVLFFALQKEFVAGLTTGAVKG
ncbi:MAG: carbohydrate ABC transporter permease [Akkermansiaceae bacterium]|nr:carbohydrate ABC transporter permease [Armatimonadota bacterium]